jgi:GT2 family glycosyltransferase
MNRAHDLKQVMPKRMAQAVISPPVEHVIVNYGSQDDLDDYIQGLVFPVKYIRFMGRQHYHQAHAWNLAAKAASGEIVIIMGADTYPNPGYLDYIRAAFEAGNDWMEPVDYKGVIAVRKSCFSAVHGYDERFEFYGPEDADMAMRLERAGYAKGSVPAGMLGVIRTPWAEKVKNYGTTMGRRKMMVTMHAVYNDNRDRGVVQVNPEGWGQW